MRLVHIAGALAGVAIGLLISVGYDVVARGPLIIGQPGGGGGGGLTNPAVSDLDQDGWNIATDSDANSFLNFGTDDAIAIDLGGSTDQWTLNSSGRTDQDVMCVSNNCIISSDGGTEIQVRNLADSADAGAAAVRATLSDEDETVVMTSSAPVVWEGGGSMGCIFETLDYTEFTDSGLTGIYDIATQIPEGALVRKSLVHSVTGFTGGANTSATVEVGSTADDDLFLTGDPDVFTTSASGPDVGNPLNNQVFITADTTIRVTINVDSDYTTIGAGQLTVAVFYYGPTP